MSEGTYGCVFVLSEQSVYDEHLRMLLTSKNLQTFIVKNLDTISLKKVHHISSHSLVRDSLLWAKGFVATHYKLESHGRQKVISEFKVIKRFIVYLHRKVLIILLSRPYNNTHIAKINLSFQGKLFFSIPILLA